MGHGFARLVSRSLMGDAAPILEDGARVASHREERLDVEMRIPQTPTVLEMVLKDSPTTLLTD